jgi:hypothetical protein
MQQGDQEGETKIVYNGAQFPAPLAVINRETKIAKH